MMLLRRTVSTESPNAFPTTGIAVPVTAFIPFIVIPSMLLVNVPSRESTPTNIVITKLTIQIALDLKNFASFPTCTLSDKFDTISNIVEIITIGKITIFTRLPIITIENNNIGCITVIVATCPVALISANKIGKSEFINPVRFVMLSLIIPTICEKFVVISVTINMYST